MKKEILYNDHVNSESCIALLGQMNGGSKEAFEQIYRQYYNPVISFLSSILPSIDDCKDIYQDLFIYIWINHQKINPERNFKSYLFTSARNMALNFLRNRKNISYEDIPLIQVIEHMQPDDKIRAMDVQCIINSAVNKMPKQRRKIFILSRMDSLTNKEISQQLHITKNAVEKHITFALRNLREVLRKSG